MEFIGVFIGIIIIIILGLIGDTLDMGFTKVAKELERIADALEKIEHESRYPTKPDG